MEDKEKELATEILDFQLWCLKDMFDLSPVFTMDFVKVFAASILMDISLVLIFLLLFK